MSVRRAEIGGSYEPRQRKSRAIDLWTAVAFLYPLTELVMFDLFGQIYLTDLAGLVLLGIMLRMPDTKQRLSDIRMVLILLGLWLFGQVATDIWRGTAPEDFLRGWGRIVFLLIQILALWLFLPRRRNYMIAFMLGAGLAFFFSVPPEFAEHVWKFGYGMGLLYLVAAGCCIAIPFFGPLRRFAPYLFALVALFLLLQNARSVFASGMVAAGICALALMIERFPRLQLSINPAIYAMLLLAGIGSSTLILDLYERAADSGMLGEKAQIKYREQAGGDLPLILGGRPESLVSIVAIKDEPILGHGSWAKDRRYTEMYRTLRIRNGIDFPRMAYAETGRIPAHSHFFGSWVEGGILGAVFWLYIFILPLIAMYHMLRRREPLMPIVALIGVRVLWDVPFSPYGADARFSAAWSIVILMWAIRSAGVDMRRLMPRRRVLASPRRAVPAE